MFTEDLVKTLIKHVKNNPLLYDHNEPKYIDFNAREVVWQKIGDEMKRPATDCKLRWINIRDANRRHLRKMILNPQSYKAYKYEKYLSFMRPFYKDVVINGPTSNVDKEKYCDNDDQDASDEQDYHQNEESVAFHKSSEDSETGPGCEKKRKKKKCKGSKKKITKPEVDIEYNPETSCAIVDASASSVQLQLDPDDPVDSFLLSVGTVLRDLSPHQLKSAKTKIFAVLQEHTRESTSGK